MTVKHRRDAVQSGSKLTTFFEENNASIFRVEDGGSTFF
jgi:hypothetical protein